MMSFGKFCGMSDVKSGSKVVASGVSKGHLARILCPEEGQAVAVIEAVRHECFHFARW